MLTSKIKGGSEDNGGNSEQTQRAKRRWTIAKLSALAILFHPILNFSPAPHWDIIFLKTRNSDKNGNYYEQFISGTNRASPSLLHLFPSTTVIAGHFNRFRGEEKHRLQGRNTLIYRCTTIHPRPDYNEGN